MPQGGYPIPPAELVVGPFGGELCEAMALPCLELEQAVRMKERAQFAECCVYGERFYRNKEKMYQTYRAFLKENGIEYVQRQ